MHQKRTDRVTFPSEGAHMSVEALLTTLQPATRLIRKLDLSDPQAAERSLNTAFAESWQRAVGQLVQELATQEELTPREASDGIQFGRLSKVTDELSSCTIDAVDMSDGALAVKHRHPQGEVSLCFPVNGAPTFEGVKAGWQVMPPQSEHVPVVHGGRMRIIYFLPNGSIEWL